MQNLYIVSLLMFENKTILEINNTSNYLLNLIL